LCQSLSRFDTEFAGADIQVAIAVACRDIDVRNVKALIIGPHETPYEFGFYEVRIKPPR
jgi:ubiquitin-conjugating enzyme E2 Z